MQILKDQVRQSIKASAIKAFKEAGYQKASMRTIAESADMSVGNLYRYYKNKEALFGELVKPMIEAFEKGQHQKKEFSLEMIDVNLLEHSVFMEQLIEARLDFRDELFILFLRAEGSPFEGAKEAFTVFIEQQFGQLLNKQILSEKNFLKGDFLVKSASAGITESFCLILEHSESDEAFLLNLLEYMELMVKPAIRNLIALRDNKTQYRRISDEEIISFFDNHHHSRGNNCPSSDGKSK